MTRGTFPTLRYGAASTVLDERQQRLSSGSHRCRVGVVHLPQAVGLSALLLGLQVLANQPLRTHALPQPGLQADQGAQITLSAAVDIGAWVQRHGLDARVQSFCDGQAFSTPSLVGPECHCAHQHQQPADQAGQQAVEADVHRHGWAFTWDWSGAIGGAAVVLVWLLGCAGLERAMKGSTP